MDYFSSAVQIGLTATPKRKFNADTYNYFGEPVYTYSLKDGIKDGFFKVAMANKRTGVNIHRCHCFGLVKY